ncbi:MAG: YggS family pyridoxal phosphate-dependent enzyme [Cyanobacteriota bacterium]|nr:YggS family pyridoxal phosphate-dependent enzyme [Cyanobacteriota bacterium]
MESTQPLTPIREQITQIRECLPDRVRLIAVTKQVAVEAMREAYAAGIRDFGESRLQEALPKQEQLRDCPDLCWHFIGHPQSNKAQKILETFQWIHACDTLKLAQRLDRLAGELDLRPNVCLQVKIVSDPNKYGWSVPQLRAEMPLLNECKNIAIQGLMTILPLGLSETDALAAFQATRDLGSQIAAEDYPNLKMQEFSMGMSGDYPLAVRAGATMVRLGRTLFGERPRDRAEIAGKT